MENKLFESVKSKSYFNKAVDWYCYRYLFCITERSWLVLVVSVLLLCVCLLVVNIYLLLPIRKDFNFVRYIDHTDDEFSVIHRLDSSKKENEYTFIAKYLIQKYIELHESNKIAEPFYQENFIKNNSTYKVYKDFKERINSEAINAYIHEKKVTNINIIKLSINQSSIDLIKFSGSATVGFITEQNKKIEKQIVEINFTLSNIKKSLRRITPFKFVINEYKLK